MDFTKLENIIFVTISGVLALFLSVMMFCVIAKGRRRTSGLDIFLRILSAITLVVGAGLFALAILTDVSGGFRIAVAGDKAFFVIGDSMTELPLAPLFVTLSAPTGHAIAVGLFIISLMTLVADCMLAKKKYGKQPEKVKKTPEQIKRDAELERIRKLSAAAVKKSNSAVSAAEKTDDASDKKEAEPAHGEKAADDDEPSFDWRVEQPEPQKEFVGISNVGETDDSGFDSFDDFDSDADTIAEDETDGGDESSENAEGEETFAADADVADGTYESISDGDGVQNAADGFVDDADDDAIRDTSDSYEKPWYEQDNPADERIIAEALADNPVPFRGAQPVDARSESEEYESPTARESDAAYADEKTEDAQDGYSDYDDGYEPDRNIYIPSIRTVSRVARAAKPENNAAEKREKSEVKPRKQQSAQKKKPAAQKPAEKPAERKTPKKQTAKSGVNAAKPTNTSVDPRKLPVTRRYVILDRTNAVNIFSNYLKEREKADKDKLESSINTIIIK